MDKFYVIKCINKDGTRGYVIDTKDGIQLSIGQAISANITQFKTEKEAYHFIKANKLERKGVITSIRTNEELMADEKHGGLSELKKTVYEIRNQQGERCFYDAKAEGYYFDTPNVGYCFWETEADAQKFIEQMEFTHPTVIVPHTPQNLN